MNSQSPLSSRPAVRCASLTRCRTRGARQRLACRRRVLKYLSAAVLLLVVVTAPAEPARADGPDGGTVLAVNDLPTVINNLTAWIVGISATVATFFLTWGFLRYMTAGGDPGQLEKAKAALRNAAIGYAGTLLAPVLIAILKQILGA